MISEWAKDTIDRYVNEGQDPGDFMCAVLANDLMQAFGRADYDNIANMLHIVRYVYNHVPMGAHGSYKKVRQWMADIRKIIKIKQELENDERMGVIF